MDQREAVREFLTTRRAKITPEQAGVLPHGRRRVPGLRREEVAHLAGVSTDYYTRLEKGNLASASDSVLSALCDALQLDDAERAHLFDLARAARGRGRVPRRGPRQPVRPSVLQLLDSMSTAAAFVWNGRLDILAINALGRALWAPMFDNPRRPANLARFAFLDAAAHDFYPSWPAAARGAVALLRTEAGRHPHDRDLNELVGELSTRNEHFRTWWASHDVTQHIGGTKQIHHPVVGDLTLNFDALAVTTSPGLNITAYTAEPGTTSADKLTVLASWHASQENDTSAAQSRDRAPEN